MTEKASLMLEKVAAALASGKDKAIEEAGTTFVEYVAREGAKSGTYVWGMGEALFVIAKRLTDRDMRMRACRLVTLCDDEKISPALKKAHEDATALFLKDAGSIDDPLKRFEAYTHKVELGSHDFRRAVGAAALKLVHHFPEGPPRIKAYEQLRFFLIGKDDYRALLGVAQEVEHLKTAEGRVGKLYTVFCDARNAPEKVREQLGRLFLEKVRELPAPDRRRFYYLYAFRHFNMVKPHRVAAMDAVLADTGAMKDAKEIISACSALLEEVPNKYNPGFEAYHPHRLKAVEIILGRASGLEETGERIRAYCLAARYADKGSEKEQEAVDGVMAIIAALPDAAARRAQYEEVIRSHAGGCEAMEQAGAGGWQKEMAALEPNAQIAIIRHDMPRYFGRGDKGYRQAFITLFENATAALPDVLARIDACIDILNGTIGYAGHPLEDPALAAFRKHLHEIPDEKQREQLCWDLMDHDREQSMLHDPPFEQLIRAEWRKLYDARKKNEQATRGALLKKIRAQGAEPA